MLESKQQRRDSRAHRLLWAIVLLIGTGPFLFVGFAGPSGFTTHPVSTAVFVFFVSLTACGLLLRWGPLVPCSILGAITAEVIVVLCIVATRYGVVWPRAASLNALGFLLFAPSAGAVIGACVGLFYDWRPSAGGPLDQTPQERPAPDGICESRAHSDAKSEFGPGESFVLIPPSA